MGQVGLAGGRREYGGGGVLLCQVDVVVGWQSCVVCAVVLG